MYSESCAIDYASVTFKESDGYVTVLTGRGPRYEFFCRVVPRKGQRLKDLEHFLAVMVNKVHLEYCNTRWWKLQHPMVEVKIVFEP